MKYPWQDVKFIGNDEQLKNRRYYILYTLAAATPTRNFLTHSFKRWWLLNITINIYGKNARVIYPR